MTLYNIKTRDSVYICTKFDDDLNPVEGSSYAVSQEACECPAGVRSTCRHRHMLDIFTREDAIDQPAFYDYDRGLWQGMEALPDTEAIDLDDAAAMGMEVEVSGHGQGERTGEAATEAALDHFMEGLAKIEGVQVLDLGDPIALHNAIADAVGEPEAKLRPASLTLRRRNIEPNT